MQFRSGDSRRGWLLVWAGGTYVIGVLGATIARNVPLNGALDVCDLAGSNERAIGTRRRTYETPWNCWHYLRTAAGSAAFAVGVNRGDRPLRCRMSSRSIT